MLDSLGLYDMLVPKHVFSDFCWFHNADGILFVKPCDYLHKTIRKIESIGCRKVKYLFYLDQNETYITFFGNEMVLYLVKVPSLLEDFNTDWKPYE